MFPFMKVELKYYFSMQGNQEELFEQILKGDLSFPSPCWDNISNAAKVLFWNGYNILD